MRKTLHGILLLGLALFAAGCSESPTPAVSGPAAQMTTAAQKPTATRAAEKITVIPLDSVAKGATVSTRRNFYFIMDGSGSMEDGCAGEEKITGAKRAVHQFLQTIPPDVNLGLYVFDQKGEGERVALGSDNRKQLLGAIDAMRAGGGTPLARAIRFGVDRMVIQYKLQLGYGQYAIIVVTDGKAYWLEDAVKYGAQYGFPVHTIGFCIDGDHPLRKLAFSYRAASNAQELARGLAEIVAEPATFDAADFTPQKQ